MKLTSLTKTTLAADLTRDVQPGAGPGVPGSTVRRRA
jgi:hypothetical protein